MFDIGFSEILLLLVVGLLVLGPERLPRVARTIGAYLGRARRAFDQVRREINQELDAGEFRKTWQQSMLATHKTLNEIEQDARQAALGAPEAPEAAPDNAADSGSEPRDAGARPAASDAPPER